MMSNEIILLLLTVLPPILILLFVIKSDKFPEPTITLIITFILGALSIEIAGYLNYMFEFQLEQTAISFGSAGFTEEPLKFLILYLFILKKKEFDEPMDGIVYATCISLGFATAENLLYVYQEFGDESLSTALIRSLTAIPLHASCGIIMGFYFGLHVFKKIPNYLYYSLLIPIAIHSSYNFFLFFMPILGLLILIYSCNLSLKYLKILNILQDYKSKESERK